MIFKTTILNVVLIVVVVLSPLAGIACA
ncbi:ilvIH operon leader peptide [Colwellia psychrerythraea 34H]|uniref:IlvIH operon leader peptide n=1 Tax=Colwellia psychrerythraea (strain 34H / ATCC BAA-681) TaxID=167879 RepID=Q47Z45_COLP3|nr:ilvIH operon leader peptide [Colwellia psychrerythraea 34H]